MASPGVSEGPRRVLMLTPDEGHLDRRIVQEAGSIATERGWEVDIYSVVDPGLQFDDTLPSGVALLANPSPQRAVGRTRRLLRGMRRTLDRAVPPAGRLLEATRYRRHDRAAALADASLGHLLSGRRYGLVFAHDVPVFPLAKRLKDAWRCQMICDFHEVFPEQDEHFTTETARRYWRGVEGIGIEAADGFIAVNEAVADYVRSQHRPRSPGAVVQNCVPFVERAALAGPSLRESYAIPYGSRTMLFAGSLRPDTNIAVLVAGFAQADLDGWALAVLGEGPLLERLRTLIERLHLRGRVFVGRHVPQRDLIAVCASADVGLLPYQPIGYNHLIATPNKLFEYIQARLPIATTRLPLIERIIRQHGNGGFVDFSTAESTAAGLRRFVTEELPETTPEQTEAAARRFSWENEEGPLLRLVDEVVSPPT